MNQFKRLLDDSAFPNMESVKHGQRLLMALDPSSSNINDAPVLQNISGVLVAAGGVVSLLFIVLMCACKDSKQTNEEDTALQDREQNGSAKVESGEAKMKEVGETVVNMTNGGPPSSTGHSRQASAGSAHMRPTSLRELPEPPVFNHVRNSSMSGPELPNSSMKTSGASSAAGADYSHVQHPPRNNAGNKNSMVGNSSGVENKVTSHSYGYDHLHAKSAAKPTDYDILAGPSNEDEETPISESGSAGDGHYSHLKESSYAVVKDVKQQGAALYSSPTEKTVNSAADDYYTQVKDEDPYNHIGDSDGSVPTSFIQRLKQAKDLDDPYATVQEESEGNLQTILEEGATSRNSLHHLGGAVGMSANTGITEDDYAVVLKDNKSSSANSRNRQSYPGAGPEDSYNMRPPEPPRLYNDYEEDDTRMFVVTTPPGNKKDHKYSKVTARESLASMTARNALNTYEIVPDLPENTYATVEGGSGDGIVLRAGMSMNQENRLSQSSDTYAEIGISGGGLSTSVISNSSSIGGANNSSSSGAPVPPSLDSLHLMTKSQTSSEGDRLSDRHLASPEDTGLHLLDDGDSADSGEDGYSTLKRPDGFSPPVASLNNSRGSSHILDEDSGETTAILNFHSLNGNHSNSLHEDLENDPNYESVDETRAKVAALRAKENSHFHPGATMSVNVKSSKHSTNNETSGPRRRRPDHDYEEVDITPPSSPVIPNGAMSSYNPQFSPTVTPTADSNMDQIFDSHMYEELSEVRAKKLNMNKSKSSSGSKSEDKRKSTLDKKKGASLDKRKGEEEKRKGHSDDKKKGNSDDKRKSAVEEKKKHEEKKKSASDEKKRSQAEEKQKTGSSHTNGTRL
ncbi:uncharacterized protein LOC131933998 [Physella acuta]|uniref:uncharacterized protein LOC131933998 n=1 Tax=Physella acuta TaxID=109671 RepID=UPI0027DC1F7C|nr:uncharacterized protein LOC131933998 [Physella acuta]